MRNILGVIFLIFQSAYLAGQDNYFEVKRWIKENNIPINAPSGPIGFQYFIDCDSNHAFFKMSGDTFALYSWGGAKSESFIRFRKSVEASDFNITRYPSYIQKDGSVVMTRLERHVFLWRNDTLYLLEEFNYNKLDDYTTLFEDFTTNKINITEYKKGMKDLSKMVYDFSPELKIIYFKDMFKENNDYIIITESKGQPVEKVFLVDNEHCGKECVEIKLVFNDRTTNLVIKLIDGSLRLENCSNIE